MANTVVFNAETSGFVQGVKSAEKQTTQSFGVMEKASKGMDDSFAKLGNQIKGLVGAYLGIQGVRKVIDFFGDCATKAGEQEKAVLRLNQALVNTGIYTPQVSKHLQELASNLQKVTIYGDETTLKAVGMAQQFARLREDELVKMIPLIQDMASALEMDLNSAAMLVGKTLGSETNALSRYGITLSDTKDKGQKLNELMIKLQARFGGQAQEEAKGYAGQMKMLNNEWGDMKERVGAELIPVIREFIPIIKELAPVIEAVAGNIVKMVKKILNLRDIQKEVSDDMKGRLSVDLMDINKNILDLCKSYGFFVDENNKVYDALQRPVPVNNLPDELRHKLKVLFEEAKIVQEQLGKLETPTVKARPPIVEPEPAKKKDKKKQVESIWAEEVTAIAKQRLDDWITYKNEVMIIDTEMMMEKDQQEMIMEQIKYARSVGLLDEYLARHKEAMEVLKKQNKEKDLMCMMADKFLYESSAKFMQLYIGKSMKGNEALVKATEYGARMMLSFVLDMISKMAAEKAAMYWADSLANPAMIPAAIAMSAVAGAAAGASAVNRDIASRHAQETQPMDVNNEVRIIDTEMKMEKDQQEMIMKQIEYARSVGLLDEYLARHKEAMEVLKKQNVVNTGAGTGGGGETETTNISRPSQAINITPTLIINAGAVDRETANRFFNEDFVPWFQRWTENI